MKSVHNELVNLGESSDQESDIVIRAAAGDRAAFEWLMRRYNQRLFRLARATLQNEAEADDALQEAYVNAFQALRQFRGQSSFATWLSRIVLNECLAHQRRLARRQKVVPIVSLEANRSAAQAVPDLSELPDRASARAQLRMVLERKVNELPDTLRIVFIMRSVEELSIEETAHCLSIPEETVRTRHFRARGMLRESLAEDIDIAERDIYEFAGTRCAAIVAAVLARLDESVKSGEVTQDGLP